MGLYTFIHDLIQELVISFSCRSPSTSESMSKTIWIGPIGMRYTPPEIEFQPLFVMKSEALIKVALRFHDFKEYPLVN